MGKVYVLIVAVLAIGGGATYAVVKYNHEVKSPKESNSSQSSGIRTDDDNDGKSEVNFDTSSTVQTEINVTQLLAILYKIRI